MVSKNVTKPALVFLIEIMITAEDGLAQCFCHELEHLDGEIFLDKAIEEIDIQEL